MNSLTHGDQGQGSFSTQTNARGDIYFDSSLGIENKNLWAATTSNNTFHHPAPPAGATASNVISKLASNDHSHGYGIPSRAIPMGNLGSPSPWGENTQAVNANAGIANDFGLSSPGLRGIYMNISGSYITSAPFMSSGPYMSLYDVDSTGIASLNLGSPGEPDVLRAQHGYCTCKQEPP